ncbi:uncharacterized protein BYT42DRAFT_612387 [Radiomyces spectabilis]|uniref:uncharacterized protein n=1 Tax=Radiomyces spectabilis TaxID=64574 RepID=UPI0022209362|nr:uncharacterized protein BYT42DRAFT_612387 [Radiomyces spectabilis]KAI8384701.1 hypothetical protein BYT42DRAFT_612387 [Radiomyces spectabilis]
MLPVNCGAANLWTTDVGRINFNETSSFTSRHRSPSSGTGLADITVAEILEIYKDDTDLLKHILTAKAEEDKRRTAEEIRRAEEARLQSKYLDLHLEQQRQNNDPSSLVDNFVNGSFCSFAGVSSNELTPDWLSMQASEPVPIMSPMPSVSQYPHDTPPSPTSTVLRPSSPFTSFEVPFADLSISASSSPEPHEIPSHAFTSAPPVPSTPPPLPPSLPAKERACKRTLSRTRSQRRPPVSGKKKNRSSAPLPTSSPQPAASEPGSSSSTTEQQLDHDKVMEALRAKIRRSSNPNPQSSTPIEEPMEPASMSPTGMLLLDLKNPRRLFPVRRQAAAPRVPVVRRLRPFVTAHNHCDKSKSGESPAMSSEDT